MGVCGVCLCVFVCVRVYMCGVVCVLVLEKLKRYDKSDKKKNVGLIRGIGGH